MRSRALDFLFFEFKWLVVWKKLLAETCICAKVRNFKPMFGLPFLCVLSVGEMH